MDTDEYPIEPHLVHQCSIAINPLVSTKAGCTECASVHLRQMMFVYTARNASSRCTMVFCEEEGHLVFYGRPERISP
jgi:hypothetical protein